MTRISTYVIAAIAIVVCAWFVIGLRQEHEVTAATTLLNDATTERSAAVQQRARSLLDAAAFLNPSVDVTLLRAQLAENERDYSHAARLIEQATAAEPDSIEVWLDYLKLSLLHPSFGNGKLLFTRLHQLDPRDVYTH